MSLSTKSWVVRASVVLVALGALFATPGLARAGNLATNLDQCRNGTFAAPDACAGSAWVNGNLGSQNSHYREGDTVPFRTTLTGLSTGASYTVALEYDTLAGGKHAYDYLRSYGATETTADATSGIAGLA